MMGGPGGRMAFERETSKPKNTSETLLRFGHYLRPYWPVLLLAAVFIITSTWAQVTVPELLGQATDCYLTPPTVANTGGLVPAVQAQSTCWYEPARDRCHREGEPARVALLRARPPCSGSRKCVRGSKRRRARGPAPCLRRARPPSRPGLQERQDRLVLRLARSVATGAWLGATASIRQQRQRRPPEPWSAQPAFVWQPSRRRPSPPCRAAPLPSLPPGSSVLPGAR